ncbi:MAG: hypothetical protein JJE09_07545, partial [Bacteroidia bacterium]|nr:hypothetical protein [Bacteroidia bacterium]
MALKNHLKKLLTGLEIPQEYVCVGFETLQPSVSIFLEGNGQEQSLNVTSTHLFLGYKPLIIGFTFSIDDKNYNRVKDQAKVTLGLRCGEHSVASLSLVKIGEKILNRDVVLYFEGKHGMHLFLNPIHQWINQQRERLRKNTPNNISLSGNLLDQVRIAYCIPRIISIITVSDGTLINMFPTDLHGAVGEKNY